MNPADALPKDWGMYYNNCWMKHSTLGIGRIMVSDNDLYMESSDGSAKKVQARCLSCWWPRPGAFNYGDTAVYIARRAMRNMRKSAIGGDHYFVKWGTPYVGDMMSIMREGPNHIPLHKAIDKLKRKKMNAVAITRDILIHQSDENNRYTVVFRGMEAGTLDEYGGFDPIFSCNPLTGRVRRQLEEVS